MQEAAHLGYTIDGQDRIVYLEPNWDDFARLNQAPHLTTDTVAGTSIWDYITGSVVRSLYQEIFSSVRQGRKVIQFPFRCDSPRSRRFMLMCLLPGDNNEVFIMTHLVREESRDEIPMLPSLANPSDSALSMCSLCTKIHVRGENWAEVEEAIAELDLFGADERPELSYSICPACLGSTHRQLTA